MEMLKVGNILGIYLGCLAVIIKGQDAGKILINNCKCQQNKINVSSHAMDEDVV